MVSADECREILGDTDLTDEQLEELTGSLSVLIEKIVDDVLEFKLGKIEMYEQ